MKRHFLSVNNSFYEIAEYKVLKSFFTNFLYFFCIVGLFFVTSCSKNYGKNSELMIIDIEMMQIDMASSPFKEMYDPEPFEVLKHDIMKHKVSRIDCILRLQEIIGSYGITHLNLGVNYPDEYYSEFAPISLFCIGDELRINYCSKEYGKYIGWKVVEMGGVPILKAIDKYTQFSSHETPTSKKYCFNNQSLLWNRLKYSGLLNKEGKLSVAVQSDKGETESFDCKGISKLDPDNIAALVPEKVISINQNVRKGDDVVLVPSPQNKTYYFQFFGMMSQANNTYQNCLDTMMKELSLGDYDTVVFDLRYNSGGSSLGTIGFNYMLFNYKSELEKYNLALVISGRTYSAACRFIDNCCKIFPNIKIFGEETGQAILNYTLVNPQTMLRLNCTFLCPTQIDSLPTMEKRSTNIHRGIMPDVEVTCTYADLMKGEDTIYKAIREYFNISPTS
jgi:hypothetical protein